MTLPTDQQLQREHDLKALARALYNAANNEEDKERLELLRHVAVSAAQAFNEAAEEDGTLYEDIGLEIVLFVELKAAGVPEYETDRKHVETRLDEMGA